MTDSLKERLARWDGCMQCAEMALDVTEALARIEELEQEANNYKFALFANQGVHNQHMANAEATIASQAAEIDRLRKALDLGKPRPGRRCRERPVR